MSRVPLLTRIARRLVHQQCPVEGLTGPCWAWIGTVSHKGYGSIQYWDDGRRRTREVHRVAYELLVGPVPEGLHLDHLCRVRTCANPTHLEPVPMPENIRRSPLSNASKTHCPKGHPYSGNNLIVGKRGGRWCRACQDARTIAQRVAVKRSANAEKTHCPQGHPYSGDNLKVRRNGERTYRVCVTCEQERERRRQRRRGRT